VELITEEQTQIAIVDKAFGSVMGLSREEIRDVIAQVQSEIEKHPQVEIPVKNYFSKDVYAREITVPKGALIVGKIHKHQSLNILSKGKMTLLSIDGCVTVEAPYTVVSSPGVKRLGYAHEECVWTTIHGTNEKDVEKIEEEFIAKSYEELKENIIDLKQEETKCLG